MRFSASCKSQHESQKNLFFWQSISLALKERRQAVTLAFCSISIERSRKDSSREETVSHVKQRVSLVNMPSKSLWTRVASSRPEAEFELVVVVTVGGILEVKVVKELDMSSNCGVELRINFLSSSISSTILLSR